MRSEERGRPISGPCRRSGPPAAIGSARCPSGECTLPSSRDAPYPPTLPVPSTQPSTNIKCLSPLRQVGLARPDPCWQHVTMSQSDGGRGPALLRRLLRAKDRMDAASHEEWPVRRLAAVSGLSESHFARSFKVAFGIPPHRYLLTRRIERAKALLRDTDLPVIEIAFQTGWESLGMGAEWPPRSSVPMRPRHEVASPADHRSATGTLGSVSRPTALRSRPSSGYPARQGRQGP